ncbi:MAG: hypothetical protein H6741_12690 [Alphaproteobacteria bacterium]|nr:hypothetical protein [Alphaproteobacteria bacterium]
MAPLLTLLALALPALAQDEGSPWDEDTELDLPGGDSPPASSEEELDDEDLEGEKDLEDFTPVEDPADEPPPPEATLQLSGAVLLGTSLFPKTPLEPGGLLRLEAGARLPFLGGRLRPAISAGITGPSYQGTGESEVLPDNYVYTLTMRQFDLRGGVAVRALAHHVPVSPELWLGPELLWVRSTVSTTSGGQGLGEATERALRVGWVASPGLAVTVKRAELLVQVGLSSARLDGALAGEASGLRVSPAIGVRVHTGR